jgi:hypothetical protein
MLDCWIAAVVGLEATLLDRALGVGFAAASTQGGSSNAPWPTTTASPCACIRDVSGELSIWSSRPLARAPSAAPAAVRCGSSCHCPDFGSERRDSIGSSLAFALGGPGD